MRCLMTVLTFMTIGTRKFNVSYNVNTIFYKVDKNQHFGFIFFIFMKTYNIHLENACKLVYNLRLT